MHLEIQVALHFLISFLYNKLPRRRVNQFGEELEAALKVKFATHWYPTHPAKGSAYRCVKTTNPLDPVFELAAHNCGLQLADIQAYLPSELCIWIDPGEVSYRMSEKGQVKLLYQESTSNQTSPATFANNHHQQQQQQQHNPLDLPLTAALLNNGGRDAIHSPYLQSGLESFLDNSVGSPLDVGNNLLNDLDSTSANGAIDLDGTGRKVRSFNPEAQCFKPDSMSFGNVLTDETGAAGSDGVGGGLASLNNNSYGFGNNVSATNTPFNNYNFSVANVSKSPLLNPGFAANKANQVTMTTAEFAQTKFGSTKLKSSGNNGLGNGSLMCGINGSASKRTYSNRVSPTEFSAYIKQRALLQANGNNSNSAGNNSALIGNNANSNQSLQMNSAMGFGQMTTAVTRSLSANFGNFASGINAGAGNASTVNTSSSATNQMLLSLSPQSSRCISPMSPMTAPKQHHQQQQHSNLGPLSYLMLGNGSANSALSSHSTSPLGAMFASNAALNGQLCNSSSGSQLGNNLYGHSNDNSLLELGYLSDLLANTSLSPVLGASASSVDQVNKNRSNSFGSRLGHLLMDSHKDDDHNAPFSTSLINTPSPFVGFGSAEFANRLSPQPPAGSSNGGHNFCETNNFGNASALQVDCNNNLISSSGHSTGNESVLTSSSSEMLGGSNNNPNNSAGNSSASSSNAGDAQANGNMNGEDGSFDSFSVSLNGVGYPNQYQHLLVAN